jgi:amino acid efflux transporter
MSSHAHNDNKLSRELGLLQLIVYYFSTIVGVGIFIVPLVAAKLAGPASIIAWVLALTFAFPFAMIFAHISEKYQVSGSIQKFLEDKWGFKFGKAIALFLVISAIFGNALLAFSAARYFNEFAGVEINVYMLGLLFLVVPVLFNLMKIGLSSRIQVISMIVLIVLIETVVITAIPTFDIKNIEPFAPNGYAAIIPAILVCFYSVTGWENVDAMAEEVRSPGTTYRKAAFYSIIAIAIFYLSIVATTILVLDHASISDTKTVLIAILNISIGGVAGKIGGVIAMTLLILGANAWIFGTSRIIFALSRDKVLPNFLSSISKNQIPHMAVIGQLIPYAMICFTFFALNLDEDTVVEITSLNYLLLYTMVFFSGLRFANKKMQMLSGCAMLVTASLIMQASYHKVGVSIVLVMLCFFYVYYIRKVKA